MKSRSFFHFSFFILITIFLGHSKVHSQWIKVSYYTLIKETQDILIIKVNRIEGEKYGEKAIAYVERSLKGAIHSDSIELPFVYTSWPTGKNMTESITEVVPISFLAGKRYAVFVEKWHKTNFNPRAAEAKYEVLNYPKDTFFEITNDKDSRMLEIERLLKIADEDGAEVKVDSLISLSHDNSTETRIDAIEALIDLKAKKAAEAFIFMLRNDPESTVRYSAALGLGYIHSDSIVNVLMECLQKEKARIPRWQLIKSLGMQRAKIAGPTLLKLYETEGYDDRNAILETVSVLGDSTEVSSLIRLFSIDQDNQHRHLMAQTIASFHTPEADEFSTALLDTSHSYWLKSAVMDGWRESDYKKGFNKIAKLVSDPCEAWNMYPLLYTIEKLGTPEKIASTLRVYSKCNDLTARENAVRILKEQLAKNITTKLHDEIEEEVKTFPSQ